MSLSPTGPEGFKHVLKFYANFLKLFQNISQECRATVVQVSQTCRRKINVYPQSSKNKKNIKALLMKFSIFKADNFLFFFFFFFFFFLQTHTDA